MNEDYPYQTEKRSVGVAIAKDILQLIIIIGAIIGLRYLLVALPMVKEYYEGIGPFTLEQIIIAGAWTLVIITLLVYSYRFETDIMGDRVEMADAAKIVQLIFLFTVILIAYLTYKDFAQEYLDPIDKYFIYNIAMLVLALIPIIFLGVVIYRNTDRVAEAIVKAGTVKPKPKKNACPACNTTLPGKMKFCPECGGNVEQVFEVQESFCPGCGQKYQKGQTFCASCGHKLG